MNKYNIKSENFRKVFTSELATVYTVSIPVTSLPNLDNWMTINPRGQNTNSPLSRLIRESLVSAPSEFILKNRGLTILAKDITFDNKSDTMSFTLEDESCDGLLDGGHTYKIIKNYLEEKSENPSFTPHVKLEFIELKSNQVDAVEIVRARNSSAQVKNNSLENLKGNFEDIKKTLADQPYFDKIAFRENDFLDENSKKPITIEEILTYIKCFDSEYGREDHPTLAYSSRGNVLSKFAKEKSERNKIDKILPILKDILKLKDDIYHQMPDRYNAQKGKFGGLTDIRTLKGKESKQLYFNGKKSTYAIPNGFIYPILAAYRGNRVKDGGWIIPIEKVFEETIGKLVKQVCDQSKNASSPNKLGKDKTVWQLCYHEVLFYVNENRQ